MNFMLHPRWRRSRRQGARDGTVARPAGARPFSTAARAIRAVDRAVLSMYANWNFLRNNHWHRSQNIFTNIYETPAAATGEAVGLRVRCGVFSQHMDHLRNQVPRGRRADRRGGTRA